MQNIFKGLLIKKKSYEFFNIYNFFFVYSSFLGQQSFLNTMFLNYCLYKRLSIIYFVVSNSLKKQLGFFLSKYGNMFYYSRFLSFKVFKLHGINMRLKKVAFLYNVYFLRVGYSHGFFFFTENRFQLKVFKNRYFLILGLDNNYLNSFAYVLRNLRHFFRYKLIGVKFDRDYCRIKIGKKKVF